MKLNKNQDISFHERINQVLLNENKHKVPTYSIVS